MITIPPVPEGIANPANLFNEAYADRPPLPWATLQFHDQLAWINEQVPFAIASWFATRNSSPDTSMLGPTMAHIVLNADVGLYFDADVLSIWLNPDLVVCALKRVLDPKATISQIKPYPGYEARNPTTAKPYGAPVTPQPWPGRTLYADMGIVSYVPGDVFAESNGDRYTKVMYGIPGAGPFGTGGKNVPAWERTYKA